MSPGVDRTAGTLLDPRQLQRRWFTGLARSVDTYMRSPTFLDLMKHNLQVLRLMVPVLFPQRRTSR